MDTIFSTDKFTLRKLKSEDKFSITENINNYKVWKNMRDILPYPYSIEEAVSFLEMNKDVRPPRNLAIAIDGKAVGVIGIVLQNDVNRLSAELGYWLGEPYWGKGIMTEAVKEMSNYAFQNFDIVRLYAKVFENNKASMKVLEKAGFKQEAILNKAVIKDGEIMDEYVFYKLKEVDQ